MLGMAPGACHHAGMTASAATGDSRLAARWRTALIRVSVVGTVLATLTVFLLVAVLAGFASEFSSGQASTWGYWVAGMGFAVAGVLGLGLTSRLPTLAYLLRLVAVLPFVSVGFVHPWAMLPAVVVGAAHVSLLLTHWGWFRRPAPRAIAGMVVSGLLALLVVPVTQELSCENVGDPPETCDVWYRSTVGWGVYEDDDRHLVGWVVVALTGGLVVAVPVARDDDAFL